MSSSRKYPYLPHGRDFQDIPPLWKFQLNLIHFVKFFGLREPPNPRKFQSPVGGVWIFSGTAQYYLHRNFGGNSKLRSRGIGKHN